VTCINENTLYVDIMAGSTAGRVVYMRGWSWWRGIRLDAPLILFFADRWRL